MPQGGGPRPGRVKYHTATKVVAHGDPVVEGTAGNEICGIAVKTKAASWSAGLVNPATVAIGEKFTILAKGTVEVPDTGISAAVKGQPIYIVAATNALTTTAAGNVFFGRVAELASDGRGLVAGRVRIDLDRKA